MYGCQIVAIRNRLKRLREAQGLSRQELANELLVSDRTIRRWEQGSIPERYRERLAKRFGVSLSHLVGYDGHNGDDDDGGERVAA